MELNYFAKTFVIILIILLLYILNIFRKYCQYIRIIKKLPGPDRHPILGNIPNMLEKNEIMFWKMRKWARDNYPAYTVLSYPKISVNIFGPDDIETLIATMKHSQKGEIYNFLYLWLGQGLLTSFGPKWQQRRKLLTPTFHFNILQDFIEIFNKETKKLVDDFKNSMEEGPVNVVPYITQFTLCSINETSMGTTLNFNEEIDKQYKNALLAFGELVFHRIFHPWLYFNTLYYITPTGLKEKKIVKILHNFTNRVIEMKNKNSVEHIDNYVKRKRMAMLDLLLNQKNQGLIDLQGVRDEINTFMFEGHDTTATALCFTLMLIATHRNIQEQIVFEINKILPDNNAEPTYQNLNDLKFMERCIKESLRLYPSVPLIARYTEEDIILSTGKMIPKGTTVNIQIFDLHRSPELYPEPDKFNPDRFLSENVQNRHPFAYLPFSAGPRNCIGQKFAMLELKAALCGILRNFVLEPVDTPDTIQLMLDLVLRTKDGIKIRFLKRM